MFLSESRFLTFERAETGRAGGAGRRLGPGPGPRGYTARRAHKLTRPAARRTPGRGMPAHAARAARDAPDGRATPTGRHAHIRP